MNLEPMEHVPVMLAEAVDWLRPKGRDVIFVDCTIGFGGHSEEITKTFDETDCLIGIDRDEDAIEWCRNRFQKMPCQVRLHQRGFEELGDVLNEEGIEAADGFLFDCGFSSPQVDRAGRGFSFMRDGPLDMRMDRRQRFSARELVSSWSEHELADIFKRYGDERFSRRIAKAIVRRRQEEPVETTQELADIVIQALPARVQHREGIHPATRVFQALRIAVNDELDSLRNGLKAALNRLKPGGRIGVLSYHSLEHRIVKEMYRDYCGVTVHPPGMPVTGYEETPKGTVLTRKAVRPCAAERDGNPRCRSAQLRVMERAAVVERDGGSGD